MVSGIWEQDAEEVPQADWRRFANRAVADQQGRAFLWAPVALSFGIWTYFDLGREPAWLALAPLGVAGLILLWASRWRPWLSIIAFALLGCVLAKAKADLVAAPTIRATTAERIVTGTVEDISASARGRRIIIVAPDNIEGFSTAEMPRRLRLSASAKQGEAALGSRVAVKALLAPLPGPAMPGGFDYGRDLWLDGIGGAGRVTGTIETLSADVPWRLRPAAVIEALRQTIGARIGAVLSGTTAAIGEALITGERTSIPRAVTLSFQVSGLAHVLSISGLHMALAAGGVFWFVRALLAAIPALALRYPIKKWAAVVALAAGLFYMLLAGTGVATQRSYIMIAVMFFAVIVDRPAISVRNLALAAVLILVIEPESALQASFQMSFMAVMGLTAAFEFWSEYRRDRDKVYVVRPWWQNLARGLAAGFATAIATTLIAGSLSSIPAAYHFGRLAPYSVLANGLALPVISFIIMPMALASMIAMPLGLEAWPLWAMGQGIDLMVRISDWVAGLPGAYVVVPQESAGAAIVTALGAAVLCLLRGPIRLAGVTVIGAGLLFGSLHRFPDLLVERSGAVAAFRNEAGELVPTPGRTGRFAVEKWLLANGEEASPAEAASRPGWTCSANRCSAEVKGTKIAYLSAEPADCSAADLVIAAFPLRGACPGIAWRIDRFDLWRRGAHAISFGGEAPLVTTARGEAGERPWVLDPLPRREPFKKP